MASPACAKRIDFASGVDSAHVNARDFPFDLTSATGPRSPGLLPPKMTYGNRRGKMLALKEREIQAQAEYVSGIGCKDLGDLTNAVRLLERAFKGGYRE